MPVSGIQTRAELMRSMEGRHKINNHTDESTIINSDMSHEGKTQGAEGEINGGMGPNPKEEETYKGHNL